ncbi:Phenylalanyl-tRNA synthetase domain protein (Bsu YtpR) [Alkalibacterium sp. AK22]|uniref:YtpR family tRNA-binding protein n=1 Tax=Alkalibacterium sp. AK22 TaxID=1229520 RepID=UPI00044E390D|nr:DUF4479 and tRNA-binding domain-containing protein [Alkalibacterium sp. AK22]EXJ22907.1 Phenylalanyl-tRNA synthetase domain protein (Bsu YtpR) [Alkalibacterium sp. AK22]
MHISIYNNNGLEDVLMIALKKCSVDQQEVESKGDLIKLKDKDSKDVVGFNLFQASAHIDGLENGPVQLNTEQISQFNRTLKAAGFEDKLEVDTDPRFVVGHVKSCEPVEGSDHLNLTQTEVDNNQVLQIVCGAGNIKAGQKVVVAKPGAVMPEGMIIWPGELKGIKSEGMVCSARELGLPQEQAGIMILPSDEETGRRFDF